MHTNRFALSSRIAVLYLLIVTFAGIAFASSEKVLHSFLGSPDGLSPGGGLVADKAENLYGVTTFGGPDPACSCGTVFELSPPATPGGAWTETILYGFHADYHVVNIDGNEPVGGLVFDQLGNLYGATTRGGPGDRGVIFELTPPAAPGGTWTEKAIFSFRQDGTQGVFPNGNLVFDDAGNLYGTTGSGGGGGNCSYSYLGCGTVFQLKPPATPDGDWTENTLYAFAVQVGDGANPVSVIYRSGVLYGTTSFGGAHSRGTAYQLASENGVWVAATIYSFSPNRGSYANALILDDAGNLFGTTIAGGLGGPNCRACGTVFELSPPAAAGKPWRKIRLSRPLPPRWAGSLNSQNRASSSKFDGANNAANGILHGSHTKSFVAAVCAVPSTMRAQKHSGRGDANTCEIITDSKNLGRSSNALQSLADANSGIRTLKCRPTSVRKPTGTNSCGKDSLFASPANRGAIKLPGRWRPPTARHWPKVKLEFGTRSRV